MGRPDEGLQAVSEGQCEKDRSPDPDSAGSTTCSRSRPGPGRTLTSSSSDVSGVYRMVLQSAAPLPGEVWSSASWEEKYSNKAGLTLLHVKLQNETSAAVLPESEQLFSGGWAALHDATGAVPSVSTRCH